MRETEGSGPLLAALDELAALGTPEDGAALDELRARLRERRLRVLVAGEAKRGKSTLVNALLGRAVLPAGVTPLTAVATTVRYGPEPEVRAVFADGRVEHFPLSALEDLVTERRNPGNRRHVGSVTVMVNAPVLAYGVELVDTPGTGSVYAHNTATAEAALETMDAAIFVLTADPPVSASERELMGRVAGAVGGHVRRAEQGGLPDRDRPARGRGVHRERCGRRGGRAPGSGSIRCPRASALSDARTRASPPSARTSPPTCGRGAKRPICSVAAAAHAAPPGASLPAGREGPGPPGHRDAQRRCGRAGRRVRPLLAGRWPAAARKQPT